MKLGARGNQLELEVRDSPELGDFYRCHVSTGAEWRVRVCNEPQGQEELVSSIKTVPQAGYAVAIIVNARQESLLGDHTPAGRLILQLCVAPRVSVNRGPRFPAAAFRFGNCFFGRNVV